MSNLEISNELAARLKMIAARENRPVEAVVEEMVRLYDAPLTEDEKRTRRKIYALARKYWQQHDNAERLALTDVQLDEQFWLIDHEGIPRLKSEIGTIELPPDPLEDLVDFFTESDLTDMSLNNRERLKERIKQRDGSPT